MYSSIVLLVWVLVRHSCSAFEYATSCKKNEVLFMHRCFCEPGWENSNPDGLNCSVPLLQVGNCECEPKDVERKFLKDLTWQHPLGYRCQALCRWNSQLGMPRSLPTEWYDNQKWKQLPFYQKDLPKTRPSHMKERLKEFSDAFSSWGYLNGTNLGRVIEFGAGGYTQTRNILEHANVDMKDVTLVDPQIDDYKPIRGCTYHTGSFIANGKQYTTYLNNTTVEKFGAAMRAAKQLQQYDTVVMMNVLVYSLDAFEFLQTLHDSIPKGGLLIFHDRWFEDSIKSSNCKTAGFFTNVLQVSKTMLDHFLSFYTTTPYVSTEQTEGQKMRSGYWCQGLDNERAYFVAVRKLGD